MPFDLSTKSKNHLVVDYSKNKLNAARLALYQSCFISTLTNFEKCYELTENSSIL